MTLEKGTAEESNKIVKNDYGVLLSDKQISEFQEIYKEHFGTEISKEDARENGIKLLRLVELIYKPADETSQAEITKHYPKKLTKKHERNI